MKNFGALKNSFNSILAENIKSKTNKKIFKQYIKSIKENEILKTQFLLFKNLEESITLNENDLDEYISENISLMDKYKTNDIIEANETLCKLLPNNVINDLDENVKELHENITTLIFNEKNGHNIKEIVESKSNIKKFIVGNKPATVINESLNIPNSLLTNISVDKYNEKYKDLNETEKELISLVIESNTEKEDLFLHKCINECLTKLNSQLDNTSNIEIKESLLKAKESLLNKTYSKDTFITDVSKIIELSKDLN